MPFVQALQACIYHPSLVDEVGVFDNMKELLAIAQKNPRTNDSRGFIRTLLSAIAPNEKPTKKAIANLSHHLGFKTRSFSSYFREAILSRKGIIAVKDNQPKLLLAVRKKGNSMYTPEFVSSLHEWILFKCNEVVPSPTSKDSVNVTDVLTGVKSRQQKYYYVNSIRDLHNALIKPEADGGFSGARDNEGKVTISDTMLRSFLPRNLRKLTDSHKPMCGCEICIVTKAMVRTRNAWQTRVLKSMEAKARDETNTAEQEKLWAEMIEYKNSIRKADGTPKFERPDDVIRSMTCPPVSVNGRDVHKLKCGLQRCDNCPEFQIHPVENDTGASARMISFEVYKYHSFCTVHKSLTGAPSNCPICEEIKANPDSTEATGKVLRKKQLTRVTTRIGNFMKDHFIPTMIKGRYHFILVSVLGKFFSVDQRKEKYKLIEGSAFTQRDYADHLKAEFADEAQSTHFGDSAGISMEGVTVRTHQNGIESFAYHSYISDDNRQDSRTTFINTDHLIGSLLDSEKIKKGSVFYELMDGCCKQYRCANALFFNSVLACKYRVTINRSITAPSHGKGDCDAQGGLDKNYLRGRFRKKSTPEVDDDRFLAADTVRDGQKVSMADRLVVELSHPSRSSGAKGHLKHQKREANAIITSRHYQAMHHGNTDTEANAPVPLINTSYQANGWRSKTGEKKNGLSSHYHFITRPELGLKLVAVRRIPCSCEPCFSQSIIDWDESKSPKEQSCFQSPVNCHIRSIVGDLNDFRLISLIPGDQYEKDEVEEVYEDILGEFEACAAQDITIGSFGAYQTVSGYHLVEWTSGAFALEEDTDTVEGCGFLEEGSIVAKGVYWYKLARARNWYTPPPRRQRVQRLFRVKYVVLPNVTVEDLSMPGVALPNRRDRPTIERMGPRRIAESARNDILTEIALRARIDYEEDARKRIMQEAAVVVDDDDDE